MTRLLSLLCVGSVFCLILAQVSVTSGSSNDDAELQTINLESPVEGQLVDVDNPNHKVVKRQQGWPYVSEWRYQRPRYRYPTGGDRYGSHPYARYGRRRSNPWKSPTNRRNRWSRKWKTWNTRRPLSCSCRCPSRYRGLSMRCSCRCRSQGIRRRNRLRARPFIRKRPTRVQPTGLIPRTESPLKGNAVRRGPSKSVTSEPNSMK